MPPTDPADEATPDRTTDRAPVRLAQALPEVLDHLDRRCRTTAARTDTDPAHPRPSPTGATPSRSHRRYRPSSPSAPAR